MATRYDRSSHRIKRRSNGWVINLASYLLFAGLLAGLVYVAWINIAPYVQLVKSLGLGTTQNWLLKVPLIGALVAGWGDLIQTFIGFLIWSVVQILQCLWLLIRLDQRAMSGAINRYNYGDYRFIDRDTDDGQVASVKEAARRIPFFFIRWSGYLALGAYTFDAIVGFSLYPPARSIGEFLTAVSLGVWNQINQGNLIKLSIMLFAFEILLVMTIIAWQWVSARTTWSQSGGWI